ncbi:MAG: alkaline phosphatase family protein [Saprospiraceae bacterium]|nr:alkaline phosphatase family protein [Saprospiraceae bacterium]
MRFGNLLLCILFLTSVPNLYSQSKTENLFVITLDGLRWQELFSGADAALIQNGQYVKDTATLIKRFWNDDPGKRRKKLMPFFWSTLAAKGQIYGNRQKNSPVNCTNIFHFSYPGYAEILCGFSDAQNIRSNEKINNPNQTFLEILNHNKKFRGKVAAFTSWDVFPYIINEDRSGIYVNAGFDHCEEAKLTREEKMLNKLQDEIPSPWSSVRLDAFTYNYAKAYIKKHHPKVVFISFGETDDFAHDGRYDHYLNSARQTDQFIADLWDMVQRSKTYRNKTTFVISTDHGRGEGDDWTSHGSRIEGSDAIWIAVLGPDSPAVGEVLNSKQLWQNQIAATCMSLLNQPFPEQGIEAGKPIETCQQDVNKKGSEIK